MTGSKWRAWRTDPRHRLYNTLIGLGRYDDACDLFFERIQDATLYRLSASRQQAELLEMLFPDGGASYRD